MKCDFCRKKCIHICCNFCSCNFCSSCVQAEIHDCKYRKEMIIKKKKNLEKQLTIEKDKRDWV